MADCTFDDLRNESNLKFDNISSELYRAYKYPDDKEIVITEPVALNVSRAGGHRILDKQGNSHYITPGWRHLYWRVKDGQPHFVK